MDTTDTIGTEVIDSTINDTIDTDNIIDEVYNDLPIGFDNSHLASIVISLDINNA